MLLLKVYFKRRVLKIFEKNKLENLLFKKVQIIFATQKKKEVLIL